MVYVIIKFHDSSLSQSEVKVGADFTPSTFHPKTKSKKPSQIKSIKTGKFDQSGKIVEKKLYFCLQSKKKPHASFQCLVSMEYLLK